MNLGTFRRTSLVVTAVFAVVGIGGFLLLRDAAGMVAAIVFLVLFVVASFAVNLVLVSRALGSHRAAQARILQAHPGATVLPTAIVDASGIDRAARDRIVAVVADRRGLSFRDLADVEVHLVPADQVMSLELAPLAPRRLRPLRVMTIDGTTIDFAGPQGPDDQVDAVVALRAALSRGSG